MVGKSSTCKLSINSCIKLWEIWMFCGSLHLLVKRNQVLKFWEIWMFVVDWISPVIILLNYVKCSALVWYSEILQYDFIEMYLITEKLKCDYFVGIFASFSKHYLVKILQLFLKELQFWIDNRSILYNVGHQYLSQMNPRFQWMQIMQSRSSIIFEYFVLVFVKMSLFYSTYPLVPSTSQLHFFKSLEQVHKQHFFHAKLIICLCLGYELMINSSILK